MSGTQTQAEDIAPKDAHDIEPDPPRSSEEAPTADGVRVPVPDAKADEDATDVIRVCRNLTNTIDTRSRGYFWFSA